MLSRFFSFLYCSLLCANLARADEGYWLFSDPPVKAIADKYHVTLDDAWLKHLSGAVVRIGGATGSFVSADGLVITNRHVGAGQLHALSTSKHNYEENGFYAQSLQDELPCKGLELIVLAHTQDVTQRVTAAIDAQSSPEAIEAARKKIEAAIEKESFDQTGMVSEIVTLFGGARYDLYQYRKFTDIRLVFAPDWEMASFGGDTDNFEFPRYDIDVCFLRVYENGQPLKSADYLKWNSQGPAKDQLVFVAGHPGFSQRLVTVDELKFQRDVRVPYSVGDLQHTETALHQFSATSPEHSREAGDLLGGIANGRKAYLGFLTGLRNPTLFQAKADDEARFRKMLAQSLDNHDALQAYDNVAAAVRADEANFPEFQAYARFGAHSHLFSLAHSLVQAVVEKAKSNGERLGAYRDSSLPELELGLFSTEPVYDDFEIFLLTEDFKKLIRIEGANDPLVVKLLAGKSPSERATELVHGTHLKDIAFRKKIYAGDAKTLGTAADPLLDFAAAIDPTSRASVKRDDENATTKRRAYAKIYQARVALHDAPPYPDATDTLRLAYGTVSGYSAEGHFIPPLTNFAGLYARAAEHGNKGEFHLGDAWAKQKSNLDLATPFNFAATVDILGGNSGSPVVNAQGDFVGIIFDGNEPSLAGRYLYDPAVNRAVAVDSAAIGEALRRVYHADGLAAELASGALPVKNK